MGYKTPPSIILHETKEVIFYISNDNRKTINLDLWIEELNLYGYKGLIIRSKCIFKRLKNDVSLSKKIK